jgi:co-chaperonin GroES (HSP10)
MKFRQETLGIRVLLKPFIETTSKGGIAIARSERSQAINTDKGEVLMIGDSAWYDKPVKPSIKPGDKVFYAKWGAKMLQDEESGEFYILCNDEDILVGYSDSDESSDKRKSE